MLKVTRQPHNFNRGCENVQSFQVHQQLMTLTCIGQY